MRFVFLDEGGISKSEPTVVVGGVIVHGDSQVVPLEERLRALVEKHIPESDHDGFVFHAKDIWAGEKFFQDREKWPWERRAAILEDLVRIPGDLEIPIVFDSVQKSGIKYPEHAAPKNQHEANIAAHSMTFVMCTITIEWHMREIWPDEIAQLVAEDNDSARAMIKGSHALLRNPSALGRNDIERYPLPLAKIHGPVLFAKKFESRPLQLADACTFLIRRRLVKHDERCARFYDHLRPMMLILPDVDQRGG